MTPTTLILRSLRHYWRTQLGVVAGVALATAVIVGALVVGDSVRHSLLSMALNRLGDVHLAVSTGDRLFTQELTNQIQTDSRLRVTAFDGGTIVIAPVLHLTGVASARGGQAQANSVQIIGVDAAFWSGLKKGDDQAITSQQVLKQLLSEQLGMDVDDASANYLVLNQRLAEQLRVKVGDQVLLRIAKPSALPRDVPLGSEVEQSSRLPLKVVQILPDESIGRFSLQADQIPPFNAFVPLKRLQEAVAAEGQINVMLVRAAGSAEPLAPRAPQVLSDHWTLADAQLELAAVPDRAVIELRSSRVFLDPPAVEAALEAAPGATKLLTYFVNELVSDGKTTPYSMVTAMDPLPVEGVRDDQIVVTDWLADDLDLQVGDSVTLSYWTVGEGRQLIDQKATFTVHSIVPLSAADKAMMPDFPGVAGTESSRDWEPGIPIDLSRIREKDEAYWKEHKGTPKAFVTLNWAREHWGNRFGEITALRWPPAPGNDPAALAEAIRGKLDPAAFGLFFRPVREEAIAASQQGTDFGGLFIGLSMFLVVAALLLAAMLFVFGVEQRTAETGTLLAVGYTPAMVRRLWLIEGAVIAAIGAALGVALGVAYTHAVLWALQTIWQEAVITATLHFHARPLTLIIGAVAGAAAALGAMAWALRRQAKQPARALLAARFGIEETAPPGARRRRPMILAAACGLAAVALLGVAIAKPQAAGAGIFFGAGALLLTGGLFLAAAMLGRQRTRGSEGFTSGGLAWRNSSRRRGRSLATITMLACGTFLIVAINAFRHDPTHHVPTRDSGTGGFALYAETALPVYHDLNTPEGREHFLLDDAAMTDVSIVQMRLKPGDEASCLNLNAPRQPTLLGVDPRKLAERDAFAFAKTLDGAAVENPWLLLSAADDDPDAPVPTIVDQSVAQWILKKGLGDVLPSADEPPFLDERGRPYRLRIVATLGNSILQGSMIISERQFTRRFPSMGGYRVMLVDAPWPRATEVKAELERALADIGIVAMPTPQRLALFTAVENTYLTIFGVLGGLGLALGCIGLAVVVLRNVLERRSELALMRSVGFNKSQLRWLVLREHWLLVVLGLGLGVVAAALAIIPALRQQTDIPAATVLITLGVVAVSALVWTALAATLTVRGRLIEALRSE